MNDRRVMRESSLPALLARLCLTAGSVGKDVLADNGYNLRPYMRLTRPCNKTTLVEEESLTNAYIDKSRVVVENAFARLKGRWGYARAALAHPRSARAAPA